MIEDKSGNIIALLTEAAAYESNAAQYKEQAAREMLRPFMLLKPEVFLDGNKWCVLYGNNIQEGVCAFGDSPDHASREFDSEWIKNIT